MVVSSYYLDNENNHIESLVSRFLEAATSFKGNFKEPALTEVLNHYFSRVNRSDINEVVTRFVKVYLGVLKYFLITNELVILDEHRLTLR